MPRCARLAAQLKEKYPRIDVLANNAGGIMGARELTVDGHEKTFQVNHLAPFLLTTELMDVLTASNATVINTSSAANGFGRLDLDDLDSARNYSTNRAYGTGKLANILFTTELHHRYGAEGITTAAFHPGVVATNFAAESTSPMRLRVQDLPQPVPAQPGTGRGHAGLARHGHARAGLGLRRVLRQAGAGEGQQAGLRRRTSRGSCGTAARRWSAAGSIALKRVPDGRRRPRAARSPVAHVILARMWMHGFRLCRWNFDGCVLLWQLPAS